MANQAPEEMSDEEWERASKIVDTMLPQNKGEITCFSPQSEWLLKKWQELTINNRIKVKKIDL